VPRSTPCIVLTVSSNNAKTPGGLLLSTKSQTTLLLKYLMGVHRIPVVMVVVVVVDEVDVDDVDEVVVDEVDEVVVAHSM